jgi:hypothetical protein
MRQPTNCQIAHQADKRRYHKRKDDTDGDVTPAQIGVVVVAHFLIIASSA